MLDCIKKWFNPFRFWIPPKNRHKPTNVPPHDSTEPSVFIAWYQNHKNKAAALLLLKPEQKQAIAHAYDRDIQTIQKHLPDTKLFSEVAETMAIELERLTAERDFVLTNLECAPGNHPACFVDWTNAPDKEAYAKTLDESTIAKLLAYYSKLLPNHRVNKKSDKDVYSARTLTPLGKIYLEEYNILANHYVKKN